MTVCPKSHVNQPQVNVVEMWDEFRKKQTWKRGKSGGVSFYFFIFSTVSGS